MKGEISSRALTEQCLAAARDPGGEGSRAYIELFAEAALGSSGRSDDRLASGQPARPLEGLPISVKDLFDVAGSVTRAASMALPDAAPAEADAPVIARLRAAGAVIVGKTNMTEFAYSGLGLNPHYGTPLNPFDRGARRIPGGSSSGAAVSVSDRMAVAAIGSDTGGSIRIPAALCGLVGWKPTASRISRVGVYPLSTSFDSIGPIGADVAMCARLDAVLSGATAAPEPRPDARGVRLAVPAELLSADTELPVGRAIGRALSALSKAGAVLAELPLTEISEVPRAGAGAVIVSSEAYAWHRRNLAAQGALYDPRVRMRLERGAVYGAWEYLDALHCRAAAIEAVGRALQGFDGWLMPTVPIVAPRIADLAADDAYVETNKLVLRNSSIVNFLGGCAITLPCHAAGEPPVGLTFAALGNSDLKVLTLAPALERALDEARGTAP
ncbi:MAG TPA: amidase [Steroidobacteraceae bacterium]|nr:amidase [Steroidobacteraceae bacterium]